MWRWDAALLAPLAATGMLQPTLAAKPQRGRGLQGWRVAVGACTHAANLPCKFLLPGVFDPHPRYLSGRGGGSKPARASPATALGQLGYFGFTNLMGALGKEPGVGGVCVCDFFFIQFKKKISLLPPSVGQNLSLLHLMTTAPVGTGWEGNVLSGPHQRIRAAVGSTSLSPPPKPLPDGGTWQRAEGESRAAPGTGETPTGNILCWSSACSSLCFPPAGYFFGGGGCS